jgi:anti-sigma regulatory factor (Ser/Thr protein kinase)
LAVSEAVTNTVLHAYRGGDVGSVQVRAQVEDESVRIAVTDQGKGMQTEPKTGGLGLGLFLIEAVADEVTVDSSEVGFLVEMRFVRH